MNTSDILQEVEKDIRENYNGDFFKCKLVLFQFFQLKYLSDRNREYIGYFVNRSKKDKKLVSSLDIPEVGALNNAGIFKEIKDIKVDDYFLELLQQFFSDKNLIEKFKSILNSKNISYEDNYSLQELFSCLKNNNEDIFRNREYFSFRFFKLSDKYAPYESVLWEALQPEFGWRLKYQIRRGL